MAAVMDRPFPDELEHLLWTRMESLRTRDDLAAEIARAERLFHGDSGSAVDASASVRRQAELRFAEWFLLERESEILGRIPGPVPEPDPDPDWWERSRSGVYLIERAHPVPVLKDLQAGATEQLEPGAVPAEIGAGDVVMGRLYMSTTDAALSPFSAIVRPGAALAEALRADFAKLELNRRLSQAELEAVVLGRGIAATDSSAESPAVRAATPPTIPLEHIEARIEQLLQAGEFDKIPVEDITSSFQAADNFGAVSGPLLDEIAFDSSVDLDACRELLQQLWAAVQPTTEPTTKEVPPTGAAPTLGADLLGHLDAGLEGKRDLEQVFSEMASMAGIDPAELDDPDEDASGLEGDLEPLVQEFYWETEADDATRAALDALVRLGSAHPIAAHSLDDVNSDLLLRLFVQTWLQAGNDTRVAAVRALQDRLSAFLTWCNESQQIDRRRELTACEPAFLEHLERLVRAASSLGGAGLPNAPALWRIVDVLPDAVGIRQDDADDPDLLACGADTARELREGDILLGELNAQAATFSGMVVILPKAAEGLLS